MYKVTLIGGGNMAAAIAGGLISSGMPPLEIEVVEIDADVRTRLAAALGVQVRAHIEEATLHDIIVLAVKPQHLSTVAAALAPYLKQHWVLSIAAGVRVADLARWLGGFEQLIRAMPNTPALVGAGITGLYASSRVEQQARSAAEAVMRAVGSVVWVSDEGLLDVITAVSGSGPAYVFYLIESLEAAGVSQGLAPAAARQLALQTFFGAAKLALESGEEPASLRARVTSKGGTTEQGLAALEKASIKTAMEQAVAAAKQRSITLGDELGKTT